ncbi:hypothetical protein IPM09_02500 [Candidatus Saccharibacteria bacterium]|nr:MAG: hypothetical protein IPM09_02500 [Candidatus Saccharibacteria bacterium]
MTGNSRENYALGSDSSSKLPWEDELLACQPPAVPEDHHVIITDSYERNRLLQRGVFDETYRNQDKPMIVGPACQDIYPWLITDPYEYNSILRSLELREIIISSALAVLDDADTYTAIVGEDTSGRIPALIIGQAINIVRVMHDLPPARRLFVSGRIDELRVPDFTALSHEDKALIITEYVATGYSISNAIAALGRVGFQATSALFLDKRIGNKEIPCERVYIGNRTTYTGRSDSHLYLTSVSHKGVEKEWNAPHSSRVFLDDDEREELIRLRKDIAHFARELVDIWLVRKSIG